MKWQDVHELPCSIARALSVIGDRWTSLIVRDAFLGVRRFEQFQQSLDISRHRLADRLERLVEEGVLERREYQSNPPRFEYRLTDKGKDLYPVILALLQWGDKWMAGESGPTVRHRHRNCGHITRPRYVCSECGEPISARDMEPLLASDVSRASSTPEAEVERHHRSASSKMRSPRA